MSKSQTIHFRRRDFKTSIELERDEQVLARELNEAITRVRPSRLDNIVELEVCHKADTHVPNAIQFICDNGVKALSLKTIYPIANQIAADPRVYMDFQYRDGAVVEQWTEMSRCEEDGDQLMVDVIKISFAHKRVANSVWDDSDDRLLSIVAGTAHHQTA